MIDVCRRVRNAAGTQGFGDLPDAVLDPKARLEAENAADLVERYPVVTLVGDLGLDLDGRLRHVLLHELGDLDDRVVVLVRADVERALVHLLGGRLEGQDEGFGRVLHVEVRTPLLAAEHHHLAAQDGVEGQRVDQEIEPHSRREAEHGGQAEDHDAEVLRLAEEDFLGLDSGARVEGDRIEPGTLVEGHVAVRAVDAARRREDHALNALPA